MAAEVVSGSHRREQDYKGGGQKKEVQLKERKISELALDLEQ